MSNHDSRVSRLEGAYPDGAARERCPACGGSGVEPTEAAAVRGLVARFAAAAKQLGFDEPPPQPAPSVDDEPPSPCSMCHGELFVTARAIEGHHAEVAQSTEATMRRLQATADALRRCDARWQRPPESMSFAEQLMSWWNRAVDATTGSPGEPSSPGAATSAESELVPTRLAAGRGTAARGRTAAPRKTGHDSHDDKGA